MLWIIVPLSIILVLIILFFLSHVYVSIHFRYEKQQPIVTVRVTLFRFISFKKEVNLSDTTNLFAKDADLDIFLEEGKHWMDVLKQMNQSTSILFENVLIHRFDWRTVAGTGEAFSTGMAGAGVWSVKGVLTGYIVEKSILRCRPFIHFEPKFNKKCFSTTFESMVSIQIGKAIHAFIKLIRLNKTSIAYT